MSLRDLAPTFLDRVQSAVDNSIYTAAAMACGFTFGKVYERNYTDSLLRCTLTLPFSCRCGKHELFCWCVDRLEIAHIERDVAYPLDMAELLYHRGAFSKQHLLDDGYPEAEAEFIDRRFHLVLNALRNEHASPDSRACYRCQDHV